MEPGGVARVVYNQYTKSDLGFSLGLHYAVYSTKLNTSITIANPNMTDYYNMFEGVATKTGSQITVNYTSKTSSLVDKMIATKTEGANVVKGNCIDCG